MKSLLVQLVEEIVKRLKRKYGEKVEEHIGDSYHPFVRFFCMEKDGYMCAYRHCIIQEDIYHLKYFYDNFNDKQKNDGCNFDHFLYCSYQTNNPEIVKLVYSHENKINKHWACLHFNMLQTNSAENKSGNLNRIKDKDERIREKKTQFEIAKVILQNCKEQMKKQEDNRGDNDYCAGCDFNNQDTVNGILYTTCILGNVEMFKYIINTYPEIKAKCEFEFLFYFYADDKDNQLTKEQVWEVWDELFTKEEFDKMVDKHNKDIQRARDFYN